MRNFKSFPSKSSECVSPLPFTKGREKPRLFLYLGSNEAKKGNGVGFFSANGNLLSVIFDDVSAAEDHQVLEFKKYKIEISVRCGIVKHRVTQLIRPKVTKTARKTTRTTLKKHLPKIKR